MTVLVNSLTPISENQAQAISGGAGERVQVSQYGGIRAITITQRKNGVFKWSYTGFDVDSNGTVDNEQFQNHSDWRDARATTLSAKNGFFRV